MTSFITEHLEEILAEWEAFAGTMSPAADTMDTPALRDHARQMLETIVRDIATPQSEGQKDLKSRGLAPRLAGTTAAAAHGALRQQVGFDLVQLVAEFRALRASVLRIWLAKERFGDASSAYEVARFNEAIDQALSESVSTYSAELANSRGTFLGILGHDLRTPLGAVWGAVEVLAKAVEPEKRAASHAAATRSLTAMRSMINDLLEYTRTRLGKGIPVHCVSADLEITCRRALEEMSLAHPGAELALVVDGPAQGIFDAERLHQVVSNLLGNAVQHSRGKRPVTLRIGGDGDSLRLQVTNYGSFIAPEHLQSIFDPLVQIEPEAGEAQRSTNLGLGLFIAREIVLAHGGTIEASSSLEAGTTFTAILPRTPRPHEASRLSARSREIA